MSLIQVIFGVHLQSDFMCRRCEGGGAEPGAPEGSCRMCGGPGVLLPSRGYTYEAPDPAPPLWSHVTVPPEGKVCTVVAHGSTYTGPVLSILTPGPLERCDLARGIHVEPHRGCILR